MSRESLYFNTDQSIYSSLDVKRKEMIQFIPEIYKDLWEMRGNPGIKYELLDKQIITRDKPKIIDFGCGKGAELVQLATRFEFQGTGIDMIPEFIDDANFRKKINNLKNLEFIVDDFKKNISNYTGFDIIIFSYDKSYYERITDTLNILKNVISNDKGYILFDVTYLRKPRTDSSPQGYETYSEIMKSIETANYQRLGHIFWDKKDLMRTLDFNNMCIEKRINGLVEKFPDKKDILLAYNQRQIEKSKYLVNDLDILTCLLKKN
jgi:cyclopropane fatty-acyl-phospholipid synthase-like methyltransferase